jgi:hypothetical protein
MSSIQVSNPLQETAGSSLITAGDRQGPTVGAVRRPIGLHEEVEGGSAPGTIGNYPYSFDTMRMYAIVRRRA